MAILKYQRPRHLLMSGLYRAIRGIKPMPCQLGHQAWSNVGPPALSTRAARTRRVGADVHVNVRVRAQHGFTTPVMARFFFHRSLPKMLPRKSGVWRYKRCAVVSNSGVLLNSEYGPEIGERCVYMRTAFQVHILKRWNLTRATQLKRCTAEQVGHGSVKV